MKTKAILFGTLLAVAATAFTACEKGNGNNNPDPEKTGNLTFNDGIELVFVEGGTYTQGSDGIIKSDEKPARQVTLSDFYIGKYEVTQKQYYDVVGHYPAIPPASTEGLGDKFPVYYVTYADAQEFLTKLNAESGNTYRLPTEAEWEYAARGGKKSKGYTYSGSNDPYAVTKYYGTGGNTWEIGYSVANELGIYDLSGNVYEWTSDWYGPYSAEAQTNPVGASSGEYRVARGGTFINVPTGLRVSARSKYPEDAQEKALGFRVAHSEE
ncbi:MAG: formylglycine-generating enzyme family protein [Prevotellaceae bacterium]|jgi:formylglycine-generating enzyme required for sulfatase activity|nr:formylglycine-generating enzyme family protein [Prevotellaceae bacterium]